MDPEVIDAEPVEAIAEAAPVEAPAEEAPAELAEPELFELPDGRKVTGAELHKEYAENLLPEFTRRSQKLAQYETKAPAQPEPTNQPAWMNPEWTPQSYGEILEAAEQRLAWKQQQEAQAQSQVQEQVRSTIDTELQGLKAKDPNLNEDKLFGHALKYGFPSLSHAHQNMVDMGLIAKTAAERTAKNLGSRAANPIAGTVTGGVSNPDGIEYGAHRAESPKEFLRRIQSN